MTMTIDQQNRIPIQLWEFKIKEKPMTDPFKPEIVSTAPLPSQLLRDAFRLLGPNGEHWIKGSLQRPQKFLWLFKVGMNYCSIGAIRKMNTDNEFVAREYLRNAVPGNHDRKSVECYNDTPETTFADITALFNRAIAAAEANGH